MKLVANIAVVLAVVCHYVTKMKVDIKLNFKILQILVLLQFSAHSVLGECNTCSVYNDMACVSQTKFQVCVEGYPNGPVNSCPTGFVCSTSNATICLPDVASVLGDCTECNQCDPTNTFACTGLRTFALCLGYGYMSNLTGSCDPSYVCNINYPYICGNATIGIPPTCPSIDDNTGGNNTVTPAPPITDPTTYCRTVQKNGRFPVGIDELTTCRQYVYCFLNDGVWNGALYHCPGSTYFNSSSGYCTEGLPARCSGTVRQLSLRNIALSLTNTYMLQE